MVKSQSHCPPTIRVRNIIMRSRIFLALNFSKFSCKISGNKQQIVRVRESVPVWENQRVVTNVREFGN